MADGTFTWGAGGTRITPEDIAARQKVAQALYMQGSEYSPVASPWQGAARMAQALLGGYQMGELNRASEQNAADGAARLEKAIAASSGTAPASPSGQTMGMVARPTAAPVSAPMGNTTIPAGRTEFVNSIMPMAQEVAAKTGLDPNLIVAQAALETGWGKSAPGGNLFGIKGPGNSLPTTEVINGQPVSVTDSFRAYASPQDSVADYAKLMSGKRYEPVRSAQGLEAQAAALGQSGYATDPQYGTKVLEIARSLTGGGAPATTAPAPAPAAAPSRAIPAAIMDLATNKYGSESDRKMGALLMQNHLANNKVQTIDLGNAIGVMDANGNVIRSIPKGEPNKGPEFGVIGKDEYGNERYGWRDPRSMTEKPAATMSMVMPSGKSTLPPAPLGVDPKIWRDAQSKRAAEEGMPASDEATSKLRQEVQGLPSYKNIAQAAPVYRSMFEAAGRDNRAADVNMIYGMAKIMDPGSVVREGEMTIAQAISTLPQQLRATVQSQLTGDGRLTPEVRAQIMQEARGRMMSYEGMFNQDAAMYRGIAKDNRMRENHVIPSFGTFDEFKPAPPAKPVEIQSKDGVYKIEAR